MMRSFVTLRMTKWTVFVYRGVDNTCKFWTEGEESNTGFFGHLLNLYTDNEYVVFNKTLIKSFYIPKIINRCKYYFNIYNKELKGFIDYQINELQKHNKNKIAAAFKNIVIDVEKDPVIFDFNKILNIPTTSQSSNKKSYSKSNYPVANLEAALTAVNNNDSWMKNIYWEESNLLSINKLNLLSEGNQSKAQHKTKAHLNKLLKSID